MYVPKCTSQKTKRTGKNKNKGNILNSSGVMQLFMQKLQHSKIGPSHPFCTKIGKHNARNPQAFQESFLGLKGAAACCVAISILKD